MSATLFDISQRYSNILDLLEDADIPEGALDEALETMDGELEDKLQNISAFIKSLDGDISTIDNEIVRLQNRKRVTSNKIVALKTYIENCLKMLDIKKYKTPLNTFSIQKNPPSVEIVDETLIPENFKSTETIIKIDKKAILKALKEDTKVEGVIKKQTESLRIK